MNESLFTVDADVIISSELCVIKSDSTAGTGAVKHDCGCSLYEPLSSVAMLLIGKDMQPRNSLRLQK